MNAEIIITLPDDRRKAGTLVLQRDGKTLFSCRCLGRSAGHASNLKRDPLKYRGDTPLGRYCSTFVNHLPKPITGIGALWVGLDPDDFYDGSQARQAEKGGRRGIGIHGGRGDALLKPTHGCVRLLDRDMADLARIAGKLRFTVNVVEA